MTRARVVDVNSYHPVIDAGALAGENLDGLIGKVSEGAGYHDPTWIANRDLARRAGIPRVGGYHFHRVSVPPQKQRDAFFSAYGDHALCSIRPTIDVEDPRAAIDPQRHADDLHTLAELFEAEVGEKPMIYTGPWWWVPHIGDAAPWARDLFLWLSGYQQVEPAAPAPWAPDVPKLWQDTSTGHVAGVSGLCDVSACDLETLVAIANGSTLGPPAPSTEDQELMAAKDEIIAAVQQEGNGIVAFLTRVIDGEEASADPADVGIATMVRSMFMGGYGEIAGYAHGDLRFLDGHVRQIVGQEVAKALEPIYAHLGITPPTPTA